jgi:hypothetical protein
MIHDSMSTGVQSPIRKAPTEVSAQDMINLRHEREQKKLAERKQQEYEVRMYQEQQM